MSPSHHESTLGQNTSLPDINSNQQTVEAEPMSQEQSTDREFTKQSTIVNKSKINSTRARDNASLPLTKKQTIQLSPTNLSVDSKYSEAKENERLNKSTDSLPNLKSKLPSVVK